MKGVIRALRELTRTMNLLPNFSVPKQKLICFKGVTVKTPASSNQKTILTGAGGDKLSRGREKIDYKLPFLLSQDFSWEAGHLLRQ